MKKTGIFFLTSLGLIVLISWSHFFKVGIFEDHSDIGNIKMAGAVKFNPTDESYTVSGSGANMWFETDEFHFVWKKMSGDMSLAANIEWVSKGVNPHRKACLIIRQNLEPNSAYADVAVHGDGLTSLQYRDSVGEDTREVQSNASYPKRVRITKEGDYIYMSFASTDGTLGPSIGSLRLPFKAPFYVGLGVCSHNADVLETAKFTNVEIKAKENRPDSLQQVASTLETIDISSFNRKIVYHTQDHIEAPNWSPDGKTLIYNSNGLLYTIPIEGGEPKVIPTNFAKKINNDHGISPDGTKLVISDQTETGTSLIYALPFEGGKPRKITPLGPSYWHGWSPDSKTLAYCAERDGNYDIYSIPFEGGKETRLTDADGLDDGPDYSPDGQYIYFNSERSGTMQIWRMRTDGSEQEQITRDQYNDWFPHPSPDGKWLVFISFGTEVPANSHPPNKDVQLRLLNLETKEVNTMAKFFGGQGTINVPSWSPDSKQLAFVSYCLNCQN